MINVGAAWQQINNELGTHIQGASVNQRAKSIRDDLEANVLFLGTSDDAVLLVSCDVGALQTEFATPIREAIALACGLPARKIIIAGTHTHSGPSVISTNPLKPIDTAYLERLQGWLVGLACEAVQGARPGRVGWGLGAARIGYNRRCCWADGSHSMHGDTSREDFIGLEGPDDPSQLAIFAEDLDGKLVGVFHNNTAHPTCFYGADFYSADFPGEARRHLRGVLGPLPIVFFNGAFGDISIESQLAPRRGGETREQKMTRAGLLLAGETLRLLHEAEFHDNPVLAHRHEDLEIAVRLPAADRLAWARETLAQLAANEEVKPRDRMFAHGIALLQDSFGENPVDIVPVHGVRLGQVALATQPCELYCQFGLDLKRRSPTPYTAVCGVADGYSGYCPTTAGIMGGGYSGEPFHWARLSAEAGSRIADGASRLLHQLWQSG